MKRLSRLDVVDVVGIVLVISMCLFVGYGFYPGIALYSQRVVSFEAKLHEAGVTPINAVLNHSPEVTIFLNESKFLQVCQGKTVYHYYESYWIFFSDDWQIGYTHAVDGRLFALPWE